MDNSRLFLVADIAGFTPHLGRLVSMMRYARWTTLEAAHGLTQEQLDYLVDSESNTIGALLLHIAAVEAFYQILTFENRQPTKGELAPWQAALELGEQARQEILGRSLEDYLDILETVRDHTLQEFAKRDDEWLHEEAPFSYDLLANNYFKWFHVFEDELNHRGQIRWLRKRLPSR